MKDGAEPRRNLDQPANYRIVLEGHLESGWSEWFDNFSITLNDHGQTVLAGQVIDQAALYGLLKKIRDLGLPLISIQRFDTGEEDTGFQI